MPFSSQSCCGEVQHRGHCCEGAAWTVSQPQLLARCRNPSARGLEPSQLVCSQLHHRSSEVSCSQLVEGTVSLRNLFVLWFPSAVGIILGAALQVSFGTHQGGKGGIAFLLSCYPLSPEGGTEQPSLSAAAAWGLRRAELSADVGTQRCSGSITALCSH